MSRFSDEYESDYNNAGDLWQANVRRALAGRKGQKALRELREALLALPEKRLISGALCTVGEARREPPPNPYYERWPQAMDDYRDDYDETLKTEGEGVCAIGAFLWYRQVKSGLDPQGAFDALPTLLGSDGGADLDTAMAGKDAGLTMTLAWDLAYRNDEHLGGATPEERYERFLSWLDTVIQPEAVAA